MYFCILIYIIYSIGLSDLSGLRGLKVFLNYCIKSIVNKISSTNCGLLEGCGLLLVKNLHSLDISKLLRIFKIELHCKQ